MTNGRFFYSKRGSFRSAQLVSKYYNDYDMPLGILPEKFGRRAADQTVETF